MISHHRSIRGGHSCTFLPLKLIECAMWLIVNAFLQLVIWALH